MRANKEQVVYRGDVYEWDASAHSWLDVTRQTYIRSYYELFELIESADRNAFGIKRAYKEFIYAGAIYKLDQEGQWWLVWDEGLTPIQGEHNQATLHRAYSKYLAEDNRNRGLGLTPASYASFAGLLGYSIRRTYHW